jgi:hypothetical protein
MALCIMNNKIAFIKCGDFSHVSDSILQLLAINLTNFHIEEIDL